nr:uncharacterized protein LOC109164445 [Ipomoea trifida]
MKLDNSSGDHPEEDDGSNQKLIDLRAAAVHLGEMERLYVVNNGDKKPFVEDEDSNPAAAFPWTLRTRLAGERNGKVVNLAQCRRKLIDLRAAAVHPGERERLYVVNNGHKKPFVEEDDSNPAAACPWTLRTRLAGERNGNVVNIAQCRRKLIDLRAAAVHLGEMERLYVVNNGDKKPFVEDEDSNPAAAFPWTLRTRLAGERNGHYDHNFTLPSCLKWGHQKRVRRMKLDNSSGDHTEEDDGSNQVQQISPIKAPIGGDDDTEAVR